MPARHPAPIPCIWLMSDERADLWGSLRRLPLGAGVVFRHHRTPAVERRRLWRRLRRVALLRGLTLVRAGSDPLPGAAGVHNRRGGGLVTWAVHDHAGRRAARRAGATLIFISPVHATRSHPGAGALGPRQAPRLARGSAQVTIALGGMDARRFARLAGFDGWAAIDAFAPRQKRKAVPT